MSGFARCDLLRHVETFSALSHGLGDTDTAVSSRSCPRFAAAVAAAISSSSHSAVQQSHLTAQALLHKDAGR